MRRLAALVGILSCAVAFGQSATEAGRGIDFRFSGPATEAFSALEAKLGICHQLENGLSREMGTVGNKPVQVEMTGARLFDIVGALEKQIGQRLEFSDYWMRPTLGVSTASGTLASSPRGQTPDCDVVLEKVERDVTQPTTWGPGGSVPGPAETALNLKLRVYPIDRQAVERVLWFKRGSLFLVHPDGTQDAARYWPDWSVPPLGRLLKEESLALSDADLTPGKYRLKGVVAVAKVDPLRSPPITAADVGRTLDIGPYKLTIREWGAAHGMVRWDLDKATGEWRYDLAMQSGLGPAWLGMTGRDAKGELGVLVGDSSVQDGPRWEGANMWQGSIASVEFRLMLISKPEDVMEEPFEISFTVPPEFVGK